MDQTTELFNSLTEDEIAKYATDSSSEEHIVIGADRKITVPSSLKRLAVQFDHNVETVTFDAPRYWDGIDMATSEFVTYINYILPDQTMGAYVAKNVRIDEADDSVMHFDWTIENNITVEPGNIAFLVCHKKLGQVTTEYEQTIYDEDGNPVLNEDGTEQTVTVTETEDVLVTHWNSEPCKECYISEGMECDEAVLEMYPDVLTQVLLAINRFEGMEVTQFVQRLEGIENDISENDSAIQVLEGKVAALEEDAAGKAEMDALKTRMTTAEADIAELKEDAAGKAEMDALKTRMTTAEGEIDALQEQINDVSAGSITSLSIIHNIMRFDIVDMNMSYTSQYTGWTKVVDAHTEYRSDGSFRMFGSIFFNIDYDGATGADLSGIYTLLTKAELTALSGDKIDNYGQTVAGHWWGNPSASYIGHTTGCCQIRCWDNINDPSPANGSMWYNLVICRGSVLEDTEPLPLSTFKNSVFPESTIRFEIVGKCTV